CGELGEDVGLRPAQCLYYTTSPGAQQRLFDEYLSRSQIGLDVEFLESDTAAGKFSFPLAGGILSKNLAAEVDPYLLTCALAKKAQDLGAQIYENTRIVCMDETDSGVTLHTQL